MNSDMSASHSKDESTRSSNRASRLPYLLIGTAVLLPFLGMIPFAGPLLVLISPNLLLLGICLAVVQRLTSFRHPKTSIPLLIALLLVLGLNTRLPFVMLDWAGSREPARVEKKLSLSVGDPIRLDSNMSSLAARNFPYSGSYPKCNEGFCAAIIGFRRPATCLARDYWKEDPDESIRTFGYTLAGASETSVPTLRIRADATEHHLELQLELVDAAGAVVGHEQRLYRNGFPLEPRDSDCKGDGQSAVLDAVLYMLHGNLVTWLIC